MQITTKRLRFLKPRDKTAAEERVVASVLSRYCFDFDRAICAPTLSDLFLHRSKMRLEINNVSNNKSNKLFGAICVCNLVKVSLPIPFASPRDFESNTCVCVCACMLRAKPL